MYLIGYRYSFTGLFVYAPSITGDVPSYQDLTFKIISGKTKLGEFSVFGIGGKSDISFLAKNKETSGFVDADKDLLNKSQLGFVGVSYRIFFSKKTFLKTVGLLSHRQNKVNQYSYIEDNKHINSMNIED